MGTVGYMWRIRGKWTQVQCCEILILGMHCHIHNFTNQELAHPVFMVIEFLFLCLDLYILDIQEMRNQLYLSMRCKRG